MAFRGGDFYGNLHFSKFNHRIEQAYALTLFQVLQRDVYFLDYAM